MRCWSLAALLVASSFFSTSHAAEGGLSNYIPGFYGDVGVALLPPEGLSVRNDIFYYNGDIEGSVRSGEILIDLEATLVYDYFTMLYNPGIELLRGHLAFGATPTLGRVDIGADVTSGNLSRGVSEDRSGIGDITFAGNVYWPGEKWHFMWANFLVAPVGRYDADDLANIGLNYWTFETDVAATYFNAETGQDYSIVVGYGYNTENEDTDYKSGDEFHVDVVLNQFFSDSFGVGLSGYFYRQLSGDTGEGAFLGDFKGEGAGIGPGFYYIRQGRDRDVYFSLKWIHDFDVENRPEGDYVYASVSFNW